MTSVATSFTGSGALFILSGEVANNATWEEDIYFSELGVAMDISGLDWKLTLRQREGDTSADVELSTTNLALSIEDDSNGDPRILRISADIADISDLEGDYVADLASQDVTDKVILWAHGVISFRPNPVAF